MKPSSVTRMLTMIFLKVFSNLWVKMLLAICKSRHSPLPKQPGKIGNVLGRTFAARVFTTTSDPHEPIIERGNKQTRCWVGNAFACSVGALAGAETERDCCGSGVCAR